MAMPDVLLILCQGGVYEIRQEGYNQHIAGSEGADDSGRALTGLALQGAGSAILLWPIPDAQGTDCPIIARAALLKHVPICIFTVDWHVQLT